MQTPLITYTPRYNEIDGITIEYANNIIQWGDPLQAFLSNKKYLKVTSTVVPKWTAYFMIDNPNFSEESIKDFYFVFGAFIHPIYSQGGKVHLLDNRGNIYSMMGSLPPGTQYPQMGVPYDTSQYQSFFSTTLGDLTKPILPDAFIDIRLEEIKKIVEISRKYPLQYPVYTPTYNLIDVTFCTIKPMGSVKPHRAFQPTVELAEYIGSLEKRKENKQMATINTQTNSTNKKNKKNINIQTNTNINIAQNIKKKNKNGFVKTLRKICNGKKCNVENAYTNTKRRHSMVNILRKTVKNSQKKDP